MKFFNFKSFNTGFSQKSDQGGTIVLELKYDMEHDGRVGYITKDLPFRLNKFSKYVSGIEAFNNHLAV
mgnify:FL=1